MRIVSTSDTHTKHWNIDVPDGDVFVHAGDISFFNHSNDHYSDFDDWLVTLPHKHKVFIAGNHDVLFERDRKHALRLVPNGIFLQNKSVEIEGIKFYGSAFQPAYYNWAFNIYREEDLAKQWAKIPDDTDVLITHTPPYQIADVAYGNHGNLESVGCKALAKRLQEIYPKLHVFGHIHAGAGFKKQIGNTFFANVSYHDSKSDPLVVDLEDGKVTVVQGW